MKTKQTATDPCDFEDGYEYITERVQDEFTHWQTKAKPRCKSVKIRSIPKFSTRGMELLYSCGIHMRLALMPGRGRPSQAFYMGLWAARDGQVFARFWSGSKFVSSRSIEVVGLKIQEEVPDDECHVPKILRIAFDNWMNRWIETPDDGGYLW